ncbi:MAG: bifunctional DNA primase/polymerase [Planctomycetes bacterium]|nr:bifunctional DNA primase/polymerase [Planctomycetota bacterium]
MSTLQNATARAGTRAEGNKSFNAPDHSGLLDEALACAERGWPVLPVHCPIGGKELPRCSCISADCRSIGKHPRTAHGLKDASTDADQIRRWWQAWPKANIGIVTGADSGLVVLDIDPRNGGDRSFAELESEHGELPPTVESQTGGGGRHLLFRHPGGRVKSHSIIDGIDVKADGGYIVAPPSMHASGQRYVWTPTRDPNVMDIAEAPSWLLAMLGSDAAASSRHKTAISVGSIPKGSRNETLASLAGSMRRPGMQPEAIEAALLEENRLRCQPPLPDDEVRRIAASISTYAPHQRDSAARSSKSIGPGRAAIRRFSDIQPQELRWLWPGRIPAGKMTLIVGDPGLGKSLFTLDVAARVSTGAEWPDGSGAAEKGGVILVGAEDDPADTIRPRLDAAGASSANILTLDGRRGVNGIVPWSLEDLDVLEDAVDRVEDCRLIVIDPISAYFAGTDTHNNASVRGVLAPVAALALRRGVAILLVSHLNKSNEQRAIHRSSGSVALPAAARAVFVVAQDPGDADLRLLLPLKSNLAREEPGLGFRIEKTEGANVPRIRWCGPTDRVADEVLSWRPVSEDRSRLDEAVEWLEELLAEGPVGAKEIEARAKAARIARRTLDRAKAKLKIQCRTDGFQGPSLWQLPADQDSPNSTGGALPEKLAHTG